MTHIKKQFFIIGIVVVVILLFSVYKINTTTNMQINLEKVRPPFEEVIGIPKSSITTMNNEKPLYYLTEGDMLYATGTVNQILADIGGADPGDPSIPPPELLISLDNSPVKNLGGVRILDRGCVGENIFMEDRVFVSGIIVRTIPEIGIILDCEQGAKVERIE